jgi:formamidopyrimidine-DNA glycosylase
VPELPEVETVRRDLEAALVGRRISAVSAPGVRTFRRHPDVADVVARTLGRRLVGVGRRGKYLLLRLDSPDAIVVHLRMSGQLLVVDPAAPQARHTHATFSFEAGPLGSARELRFVDPRTFGEVFVSAAGPPGGGGEVAELAHLGVEPLDPALDAAALGRLLRARRAGLKALLLDQRVVAGIGNIYADEILWRARIRHSRRSDALSRPQVGRLHDSMVTTLLDAIAHRGSSLADEQYRDLYGRVGSYQQFHNVHGRERQPCPRCGGEIRRVRAAGRSTYFCPRCQR